MTTRVLGTATTTAAISGSRVPARDDVRVGCSPQVRVGLGPGRTWEVKHTEHDWRLKLVEGDPHMAALDGLDEERSRVERLEARVAALEEHITTLTAAVDAASRMRLGSDENAEMSGSGGEWVRHILEKGGLVGEHTEPAGPE
jgi:hypothetical protein